jgi:uncharacterized membrane protein
MDNTIKFFLFLHILAAVLWVGGGVTMHVFGQLARKSGDRVRMLQFARDASWIGPRMYAPLSVVLLICGIVLVNKESLDMSETFVSIGLAGWVVSLLLGVLYYTRAQRKMEAVVASDGLESDGFLAQYRQVMFVNIAEQLMLMLIVFDMTWKPGL